MSATDYVGSPLEQLMAGLRQLPTEDKKEEPVKQEEAPVKTEAASPDDLMASLGLG